MFANFVKDDLLYIDVNSPLIDNMYVASDNIVLVHVPISFFSCS